MKCRIGSFHPCTVIFSYKLIPFQLSMHLDVRKCNLVRDKLRSKIPNQSPQRNLIFVQLCKNRNSRPPRLFSAYIAPKLGKFCGPPLLWSRAQITALESPTRPKIKAMRMAINFILIFTVANGSSETDADSSAVHYIYTSSKSLIRY